MRPEIETDQVEQLWYTWSTTGLDQQALAAGFRVRAASPGLMDLYGEYMQQLDRYLRYSLPPGADPLRTRPFNPQSIRIQEDAPISLTFARLENGERVLIHKVYTGKDGRGRPGAYFAHLLTKLPIDFFSARDAIRLWRLFPFWHTSDLSGQLQDTTLDPVELDPQAYTPLTTRANGQQASIRPSQIATHPSQNHPLVIPKIYFENAHALSERFLGVPIEQATLTASREIDDYLRLVIQAYLLRQKAIEDQKIEREKIMQQIAEHKKEIEEAGRFSSKIKQLRLLIEEKEGLLYLMDNQEPPRIFIAAPPDMVAYLIAGLTRLLPRQFLKEMTFSTYEDDVLTKLPLDIVGTCKPPVALNRSIEGEDILPAICYQKGFAINTYPGGKKSPLSQFTPYDAGLDPRIMAEHTRTVIDIEGYANFAVDELRGVMLDSRQAYYRQNTPTSTMLTPIEEVDDVFRELGDIPEKSLDALSPLNISEFLNVYITSKQIPLDDNKTALQDIPIVIQRLERRFFRRQIFHRNYQDSPPQETQAYHLDWLRNTLPPILTRLRKHSLATTPSDFLPVSNLGQLLDELAMAAVEEIQEAVQKQQDDSMRRFLALFAPLKSLEPVMLRLPEEPMTAIWQDLLARCYKASSQKFITDHWEVREKLLEIAIEVLPSGHDISKFLLNVKPIEFGTALRLLQGQKPEYFGRQITENTVLSPRDKTTTWLYQTISSFLEKGTSSSSYSAIRNTLEYDRDIIQQMEKDFAPIKKTFEFLLYSPESKQTQPLSARWQAVAQSLFLALVNSGYEHQSRYSNQYKMELTELWFNNPQRRKDLPAFLADSVPFSVTELEGLLITHGSAIQQQAVNNEVIVRLFWRIMSMSSPQKMPILFRLLDRYVSQEKFDTLLNYQSFEIYVSTPEILHLLKPYQIRSTEKFFNAEESHLFLMHYSQDYVDELSHLSIPSNQQRSDEDWPQYAFHYPNAPIWLYMLFIFQAEGHFGRMPLVYTIIRAALQTVQLSAQKELDQYLTNAHLTNDEYDTIVQRFGPDLLTIPALAPLVPHYYNKSGSNDFKLLLTLLDTVPNDRIANQLLIKAALTDHAIIVRYFRHYSKKHPPFCYRLPYAQELYKQLAWEEIQPLIPWWLASDMTKDEVDIILGYRTVRLKELDHTLTEIYAKKYLEKDPQSGVFLSLCQYYLETFDANIFERPKGRALLKFLYTVEKQQLPTTFWGLNDLIDTWYMVIQFIEHPTVQPERVRMIFTTVYEKVVDISQKPGWIAAIARAQVTCITYSGQLGPVLASFCIIYNSEALLYVQTMIECIRDEITASERSKEPWLRRVAVFLEFLFSSDLLATISPEKKQELIGMLQVSMGNKDLSFIQRQATSWSPAIKAIAQRRYGFTPEERPIKLVSLMLPMQQDQLVPGSTPPIPDQASSNTMTMLKSSFFAKVWLLVYAWLIFPWLLLRLGWLIRKGGVDRLAYFWRTNKSALQAGAGITPNDWKVHLEFACQFHYLCWDADNDPASVEADKALVELLNIYEYDKYAARLTTTEIVRVSLATERIGSPRPAYLPQIRPARRRWRLPFKRFAQSEAAQEQEKENV